MLVDVDGLLLNTTYNPTTGFYHYNYMKDDIDHRYIFNNDGTVNNLVKYKDGKVISIHEYNYYNDRKVILFYKNEGDNTIRYITTIYTNGSMNTISSVRSGNNEWKDYEIPVNVCC